MAPVVVDTYKEPSWKYLAVPTTSLAAAATVLLVSHYSYFSLVLFGAFIGFLRASSTTHVPKVHLRVEDGELYVGDGKQPTRLLDARQGIEPEQLVLSKDDGSTLVVRASNQGKVAAVLDALRPRGTAVSGRLPTLLEMAPLVAVTVASSVALVALAPPIAWLLAAVLPIAVAAWLRGLQQIVAGTDGIELRSRRGRRFVPYVAIERVESERVVLKSGELLTLAPDLLTSAFDPSTRRAAQRVLDCVQVGTTQPPASALPVLDAPQTHGANYRDGSLPDAALWDIVERSDAEPELRARAAELLRVRVEAPELRVRIADVVQATARSETRDELLRIADAAQTPLPRLRG